MITKILEFLSPFARDHLHRDSTSIHNALKAMAYGQAAISFSVFMNKTFDQSLFLAIFAFLFPIFIALGASFGIMAQQDSKNGQLLVVGIFIFLCLTLLHFVSLSIFFFSFNKLAALALILSIIAIFNIAGWAARLYTKILKSEEREKL